METAVAENPVLTANQRNSLRALGLGEDLRSIGDRPTHEPGLAIALRENLEQGLSTIERENPSTNGEPLVVSKFDLATVFGCEGHYLASREEAFEWSISKARGTVLHKVQQASVTSRGASIPVPTAVEQAIERLHDDPDASIGAWLQGCSDFQIAELAAEVTELAVKIRTDMPPIQPRWQPRSESRARVELCDRRYVLLGKMDLALGSPRGNQARTFILDYKSGATRYEHADELRFYALLETLRAGIPPWRAAVFYVDLGEWLTLDINVDDLRAASRRLLDGVAKLVALSEGQRKPTLTPGPCTFCPALSGCSTGKAHLLARKSASI